MKNNSNNNVFDFNKQLRVGGAGEKLFLDYYKKEFNLVKTDGIKYDFESGAGHSIELKTDTYPMNKTPNFFMERLGNVDKGKNGGPWRAYDDNVNYFVYLYIADRTAFWFETNRLIKLLNDKEQTFKSRNIRNRSWTTMGYMVPRSVCECVLMREDKI